MISYRLESIFPKSQQNMLTFWQPCLYHATWCGIQIWRLSKGIWDLKLRPGPKKKYSTESNNEDDSTTVTQLISSRVMSSWWFWWTKRHLMYYHESRVSVRMALKRRTLVWQIRVFQAQTPLVKDVGEKINISILERIKRQRKGISKCCNDIYAPLILLNHHLSKSVWLPGSSSASTLACVSLHFSQPT